MDFGFGFESVLLLPLAKLGDEVVQGHEVEVGDVELYFHFLYRGFDSQLVEPLPLLLVAHFLPVAAAAAHLDYYLLAVFDLTLADSYSH